MELIYCEMPAGTAIFFHGNILHRSDANLSETPRWALRCVYNAVHNDPYKDIKHARYTPLEKVPDSKIKAVGARATSKDETDKQKRRSGRPKNTSIKNAGDAPIEQDNTVKHVP